MNIVSFKLQKKIRKGEGVIALFLLVMLASFIYPNVGVADMSANIDASYYKTTTTIAGKTTESTNVNQGYSLHLSKVLTSTINIAGDIRLSKTDTNGKETEDIYPLFYLNYTPPSMYYFSFSYNRNENFPPGGERIATSNTNMAFFLPLEKWPSLSLTFNRSTTEDFLDIHKVNTVTTSKGANISHNFDFLEANGNLAYAYTNSTNEDKVANTKSDSHNHLVSANLSRSFLNKSVLTSASFGYNQLIITYESLGAPIRFEEKLDADEGLFSVDTSPSVDSLAGTPALIDNNTSSPAVSNDLDTTISANIGLRFAIAQSVHKIHLYIDTSYTNIGNLNFGWQLYTSNDGTNWTPPGGISLTPSYEAVTYKRFIFTFSEVSAKYFKIVNSNAGGTGSTIYMTEIEAFGYKNVTPTLTLTTETKRDFGGINISFIPNQRLNMNYSVNYNHDIQDINDYESTGVNQSSVVALIAIPQYLTLSTGYTTSTTSVTQKASATSSTYVKTETGADSYTVTLSSNPLKTLGLSLNYGHNETLTEGETQSTNDTIAGSMSMNLYKGVDLNLGSSINESKDIQSGSKSSSQSSTWNLNLAPWRALTIGINGSVSNTTTESAGASTSSTASSLATSVTLFLTKRIYFTGTMNIEPTTSHSYNVSWVFTRNMQIGLRYGLSGDVTNMGVDLSWMPVSRFNMHIGWTGTSTDNVTQDSSDSISASVSLRL